jgi:hypothetical protein
VDCARRVINHIARDARLIQVNSVSRECCLRQASALSLAPTADGPAAFPVNLPRSRTRSKIMLHQLPAGSKTAIERSKCTERSDN